MAEKVGAVALVLFNGIGCFLEALKRVNFPLEAVHACDWDRDATRVAQRNFPGLRVDSLPQDVTLITEDMIRAIGHIDVFMASPPCTDLSSVKVDRRTGVDMRKGFDGPTGCLFRKTIEVWKWVRKYNPQCKLVVEASGRCLSSLRGYAPQ